MASTKPKNNWKLSEFVAHASNVNCLSLSPSNGRMLATGGDDRKVNLWLMGKPNNIMSISGMTSPVQCVTFNNSENWLGAGSKSGVVKVFDLEGNRTVRSISGHKAAISSLDFHRYGDILGSGSMDTNLKVWDVRRKGCIFTYKGHTEVIKDIQFSPDGKWVATASSDNTIKIWDLSAGKIIVDFKTHMKAVTTVQFHPREFLMASGSTDRTVKFYDLENFTTICETPPESNGVRKIIFHPEGTTLFTGTEESLKVHGWEPARTYDTVPLHWGRVEDMTLSGEQLIAASCSQTNVSVWCIDIQHLCPFSGKKEEEETTVPSEPASSETRPPTTSGRRLFEYEQKEISPPSSSQEPRPPGGMAVNGGEGEGPAASTESENSPPSEMKVTQRMELFEARQRLIRTPPKKLQAPLFRPPSGEAEDRPPARYPQPQSSQPPKLDQVQYIPNLLAPQKPPLPTSSAGGDKHSALAARRLHQPHDPIGPAQSENIVSSKVTKSRQPTRSSAPSLVQSAEPYGIRRMSSRGVEEIITNHVDVSQMLESRLASLREVRGSWSLSEPKVCLEMAINCEQLPVLVDVLSVFHLKRTLWSLDMAVVVLPELELLLRSKYTIYVGCGCNIIKLILRNFGPVIKSNLATPPQGGRDLQRDQRYEKCQVCHAHLLSLREEGSRIVRESPTSPAGKVIRERALMAAFTTLN